MIDDLTFWTVTVLLGIGTFLIRFSFIGFFGGRELPSWATLHLKYVAVAVFPALITPLIIWPAATDGQIDPPRIIAAVAALAVAVRYSVVGAIVAGMGVLYLMQYLLG